MEADTGSASHLRDTGWEAYVAARVTSGNANLMRIAALAGTTIHLRPKRLPSAMARQQVREETPKEGMHRKVLRTGDEARIW